MILDKKNRYDGISFVISIFLCLIFHVDSFTQSIPAFHHISTAEGLPNNNIKWIATDEFGMVWIAAENGVARFDGTSVDAFKSGGSNSYGPAGGNVHYIGLVPGSNSVWIGATTGLSRYDQKTGNWSRIPILYNDELKAPLPTYIYPFHIDNKKVVWLYVGNYGSICKFYPATGALVKVKSSSDGRVYTPDSLFSKLRYTASAVQPGLFLAEYRTGTAVEKRLYGKDVESSFFTERCYFPKPNELWMATDRGLVLSNPISGNYKLFEFPSAVTALCPDKLNPEYIWLGTNNHGIYRFDMRSNIADLHIEHDPENQYSIRSNQITFLHADSLGRLYAGLAGKGVAYTDFSHSLFSSLLGNLQSKQLGINNSITHVFPLPNGDYLLGTASSGLIHVSADNQKIKPVRGISGEQVYSGIQLNDKYLIQSSEGFYFYDINSQKVELLSSLDKKAKFQVFNWIKLGNGQLYAGTNIAFFKVIIASGTIKFEKVDEVSKVLDYNYIQYVNYDIEDDLIYIKTNYTDFSVF
jgi:ligand-binding sensor domain-containing protein